MVHSQATGFYELPRIVLPMNHGAHPPTGRLGWLLAALLFGVLAGGGIAWMLINRHPDAAPVVIYQMPNATPSAAPDDSPPSPRRRNRTVHAAEDLPGILEGTQAAGASLSPSPDLAVGLDGSVATEPPPSSPVPNGRQTVLVDGIAITRPPSSATPTPAGLPPRPLYEPYSAEVDDSLTYAIEGIQKYTRKGYTLREETWGGGITVGKPKAISHQLYKGNDYWFALGCSAAGSAVRVRLYDSDGNPADTNYWQHETNDGSYAAAEILCQRTGTYFVVVSLEKAREARAPWGVVYAYR